jgi:hypothetical protein
VDADVKPLGEPAAEVVSTQRWLLTLPVTEAVGEDVWCACIFCGLPRQGTNRMIGTRVEFLVRLRNSFGSTVQKGLHKGCWKLNVTDVPDYIGALDAANRLIGEAADEAIKLTNERDQLGDMCAGYEEKFKLQRDVVDAATALMLSVDGPREEYEKKYTALSDAVRVMRRTAKERDDGTI